MCALWGSFAPRLSRIFSSAIHAEVYSTSCESTGIELPPGWQWYRVYREMPLLTHGEEHPYHGFQAFMLKSFLKLVSTLARSVVRP